MNIRLELVDFVIPHIFQGRTRSLWSQAWFLVRPILGLVMPSKRLHWSLQLIFFLDRSLFADIFIYLCISSTSNVLISPDYGPALMHNLSGTGCTAGGECGWVSKFPSVFAAVLHHLPCHLSSAPVRWAVALASPRRWKDTVNHIWEGLDCALPGNLIWEVMILARGSGYKNKLTLAERFDRKRP